MLSLTVKLALLLLISMAYPTFSAVLLSFNFICMAELGLFYGYKMTIV